MPPFRTTADAMRAAVARQTADQCATGRHVPGCPHRVTSPWVRRAEASTLPPKVYR